MTSTDPLSATFAALSDPTRRAILERLARGPATVKELAAPFNISGPAISKHLKVLESAKLVVRGKEAQWRPCALAVEPIHEVSVWTERYRRLWELRDRRARPVIAPLRRAEVRIRQR